VHGVSPTTTQPQDRCLSLKVKTPSGKELQMKNCSDAYFCHEALICHFVNSSRQGMMSGCKASCCFGNLCNTSSAIMTQVLTGLVCLLALFGKMVVYNFVG
jgi:hypothetical protein